MAPPDPESYLAWVEQLAAGVGDRPGLVVLEPDAVPQSVSGACGGRQDLVMLAQAVHLLKTQPGVRVYIDAGHPGWITDLPTLAEALKVSGVEQADGFSLNVLQLPGYLGGRRLRRTSFAAAGGPDPVRGRRVT